MQMKGSRALIMLLVSLVAGIAAVVLAARWLSEQKTAVATSIVVAARDIDAGEPIAVLALGTAPWPAEQIPPGAFRTVKELEGRVPKTAITRGEPVLDSRLMPPGARGGLSTLIGDGQRAITVRVNEVVGVAGFALPGNFVDVLVNTSDERDRPISKIVLERILVLAVAQEASRDDTKPRVVNAVTLEVTPGQAERLDLARSVGTLSLVLRSQTDKQVLSTNGVRKEELLGSRAEPVRPAVVAAAAPAAPVQEKRPVVVRAPVQAHAEPVAPPKDPVARVEVIRGIARSGGE